MSRCCSRSTSEPSARALSEGLRVDLLKRMLMPNIRSLREKIKPSKTNDGDGMRQAGSSICGGWGDSEQRFLPSSSPLR